MKLTLTEPKYIKNSISIISELVNEARFKVTKDAIELIAMDPANVAMVIFKLLSSSFIEYDVKEDVELAVNLGNLKQVMRRAKPNDSITLELSTENKLDVIFKSNNVRKFSLPIIELEEKDQKEPELNFPISITTTASNLSEAIEDVDIVAESVSFVGETAKFVVLAEGDLSKAMIEIKKDSDTTITTDTQDKIKAKYSTEYLKKMVAGSKLADTVTIKFNKDYPLLLEFKTDDKVFLKFILAPRVVNE